MTTFCYPYKRGTGRRTQNFRASPGGFNPAGGHTGYDQAMPVGTPLYAPGDGVIRLSSWVSDNYLANDWWLTRYGGDMIVLDCTDAFGRSDTMPTFIIAHLSDSIVPVGAKVKKGQLIAKSGNSGTATTGPHAHIEALPPKWDVNNGVYGRVNPESYFTEWPEDVVKPVVLKPHDRVVGKAGVTERKAAVVSNTNKTGRVFKSGDVLTFKGFERGQTVNGSNVWFIGSFSGGRFHSSAFVDGSTKGLPDLTPKPVVKPAPKPVAVKPVMKVAGAAGANMRKAPNATAPIVQFFKPGSKLNFKGWTRGARPYGPKSSDVWLIGISGGFIHSSTLVGASLTGLPEVRSGK